LTGLAPPVNSISLWFLGIPNYCSIDGFF